MAVLDIEFTTNRIEPRTQLLHWLEMAARSRNDKDLYDIISRLKREILYYKAEKHFRDKLASKWINSREKDVSLEFMKESDERLQKAIKTKNKILSCEYEKAIEYLKEHSIEDEALQYGDSKKYGGEETKSQLGDILNMCVEFIHQKAKDYESHELYNDQIDEWYFKHCEDPFSESSEKDIDERYFFPKECFILKLKDLFFCYEEISGQGTVTFLSVLDDLGFQKLSEEYFKSVKDLKEIAYDLEEIEE